MRLIITNKKNIQLAVIGLFLFSCVVYSQTLFYDFIWDDLAVITFNKNITSPQRAVTTFYQQAKQPYNAAEYDSIIQLTSKNWRPLRTLVHSLVYKIFKLDPLGYHLLNIIFHALVVVLLFLLLLNLVEDLLAALVGALLFAVHPVNTEVVCWSKSLEDLMATFFILLTFNLFLYLKEKKITARNFVIGGGCIIFYGLALASKLSVIFFPLFLLLCFAYRWLKSRDRQTVKDYMGFRRWQRGVIVILAIETIVAIIARSVILGKVAQGGYLTGSYWTTWLSMPRVLLRYLQLQLLPYPLYADYMNYPQAHSLTDLVAWGYAVAFLVIFSSLTWLLYKKKLFEPWLWFWCALLPFLNIIAMQQLGAERFLYIPTVGFAWLVAEIFKRYSSLSPAGESNNKKIKLLIAVYALFFLLFLVLTVNRSQVWSNRFTFWSAATEQFPHSQRIRRNLIKAYIQIKQPAAALPYAKALLKEYPLPQNVTLLAHVSYLVNDPEQVIDALYRYKKNPALNYIAILAAKRRAFKDAEQAVALAYQLQPDKANYDSLNRVAIYAAQNGYFAISERCLLLASTIDKNDNSINLVGIYATRRGKLDIAERCFTLAAQINPVNKKYRKNLQLLQQQRRRMK